MFGTDLQIRYHSRIPLRAPLKGLLLRSEILLSAVGGRSPSLGGRPREAYFRWILTPKGLQKGFSNRIESEGLFRTSGNSKSLFLRFLALVEVFGDFRCQIRIQHVALYHIDPWKHRKYSKNSQKQ